MADGYHATLVDVPHVDTATLAAGLAHVRAAPTDHGVLARIVARTAEGERVVLTAGELTRSDSLVGDDWARRPSRRSADGLAHPDMQLNVTGIRFLALIAPDEADQILAGDQLHVDLDLSEDGLPAGTRLRIGEATIEITDQPHTGCAKYRRRFGEEALRFVNSLEGRALNLRGRNARVVVPGTIGAGDAISRLG